VKGGDREMSSLAGVANTNELEDGSMKTISIQGLEILLARIGGSYYAVDNVCTHMKGRLSQGNLEEYVVTCPRHGSQFDIRSGQVVRWLKGSGLMYSLGKMFKPPRPIKTYRVEIRNGRVWVEI